MHAEALRFCLQECRARVSGLDGFAGIFKEIGIIGDSLSSGELESHDEDGNIIYHGRYEYSWPAVPGRLTGTVCHNYSRAV